MTFQTVPVQVAGGSSPNRSKPLSVQRTLNMWPQYDKQAADVFTLQSMYGVVRWSVVSGSSRGMFVFAGVLYRVVGGLLYSVDSAGVHTEIGAIAGSTRCTFAATATQMAICNGSGHVYAYTASGGLVSVTDTDIDGALVVDIINNQFLYTMPNQTFVISNVGDATTASGLNSADAEAQPDELIRAFVFDQIIRMMGADSLEVWVNTGVGNPPLERQSLQVETKGLAGRYAVASNDEVMYWLSNDGYVYRMADISSERVSSKTIAREFESYSDISDCEAYCFTIDGQNFVMFRFPSQGKVWCLSEELGQDGWFELSMGVTEDLFPYSNPINIYNKTVLESSTGALVYLDEDAYTYESDIAVRERVLSPVSSDMAGVANKEIRLSRLSLIVETGVGLISGQGEDPIIRVEASIDGGRTWMNLAWPKIGRLGDYKQEVRADFMLTCYECVFKLVCTDPVKISIHNASCDMKLTGRR